MNANKSRFRGAFRVCAVLFSAVSVLVLTLLLSSCNGIMLPSENVMNVDIGSILVQYQDSGGAGQTIAEESNFTGRYSGVSGAVMITSSSSSAPGQVTGRAYNIYTGELLASVKDGEELGFIESFGIPSEQVAGIFYAYRDGAVYIYNEDGSVDVMNAAWGTMLERNMVILNLTETHKTVKNIKSRKGFTVSIADAKHVVEADYFGVVSGNVEPNKFEKSGLSSIKSENVDAPIIKEFPLCMECEFIEYQDDEYGCGVIGKVINVTADESVMNGDKVDIEKVNAIAFDPYTHGYYRVTERVGEAFKDGLILK